MNPAPCSWRVRIKRMLEFFNEFSKSRFSSPGTPKMYWTPSFSNAFTNKSDAFISFARDTPSIRSGRDSAPSLDGPGLAFSALVGCYLRLLTVAIPVVSMLAALLVTGIQGSALLAPAVCCCLVPIAGLGIRGPVRMQEAALINTGIQLGIVHNIALTDRPAD
jgi:hypothetical protein